MAALDGSVDIPAVGKTPKKYVAVGVALVLGIVGFAWYRRATGDSSESPSYFADTRTGANTGTDSYDAPPSNSDGQSGTGIGGDDLWKAPRTNEEWAQQVIDRLMWYEPSAVSQAVGKYLSRQQVTPDEATIIREAWAQIGRPPLDVPLNVGGSTTTPPPASGSEKPAAPFLHHVTTTKNSALLRWSPGTGAASYIVYRGVSGSTGIAGQGIKETSFTVTGLRANTRYSFSVASVNAAGARSGKTSNVVTVTTKK